MKNFLLLSIILSSLLLADVDKNLCQKNLDAMLKYSLIGDKNLHQKDYEKAKDAYEKSIHFSIEALDNCKEHTNYDFNLMYNYRVHSENQIDKIYTLQAYQE